MPPAPDYIFDTPRLRVGVLAHAGFVARSELVADIGSGYMMDDFLMAKSLVDPSPAPEASGP